jgi:hypothetical protein
VGPGVDGHAGEPLEIVASTGSAVASEGGGGIGDGGGAEVAAPLVSERARALVRRKDSNGFKKRSSINRFYQIGDVDEYVLFSGCCAAKSVVAGGQLQTESVGKCSAPVHRSQFQVLPE